MTGLRRRWTRRGSLAALAGAVVVASTAAMASEDAVARGAAADVPGVRRIHLIGDSWAAGLHADPANALGQVAARALGWPITVDAISGTGYLNDAGAATYLQRAAGPVDDARIVVVQGGSNDDDQDIGQLPAAVAATITALQRRFPDAALVLLGPGPDPAPVTERQLDVDEAIAGAAAVAGVPYVSMLRDRWIPEARIDAIIDAGNHHPTRSGQQYLGLRLAAELRLLLPDVVG